MRGQGNVGEIHLCPTQCHEASRPAAQYSMIDELLDLITPNRWIAIPDSRHSYWAPRVVLLAISLSWLGKWDVDACSGSPSQWASAIDLCQSNALL